MISQLLSYQWPGGRSLDIISEVWEAVRSRNTLWVHIIPCTGHVLAIIEAILRVTVQSIIRCLYCCTWEMIAKHLETDEIIRLL